MIVDRVASFLLIFLVPLSKGHIVSGENKLKYQISLPTHFKKQTNIT